MSITEKLNRIKSCKEDIKQAIIDKGVDMTGVSLEGYATKISEIPQEGGSGDYLEIRKNLQTYSNKDITALGSYDFAYCTSLQSVNLPNLQSIGGYSTFDNCSQLTTVNTPNLESLGDFTFAYCNSLTSIDFPKLQTMGYNVFEGCVSLTTVNLPNMTGLPQNVFKNCPSLVSADLPNVKKLPSEAFSYCPSLESVNLPICEIIESSAFTYSGLKSIELPKCLKTEWSAFQYCDRLQTVNLPKTQIINGAGFSYSRSLSSVFTPIIDNISYEAFCDCESLTELDISKTYWCRLDDVGSFNNTPFMNGEGKIYVHNSVLSKYQNDTNWTMFSDCFVGVGDADKPALAFDNGRVYGDTSVIYNNFNDFLGITKEDVSSIDLPNVEMIYQTEWGEGITFNDSNLVNVNLPNATYIHQDSFGSCEMLQTVNLPNTTYIGNGAFSGCNNLQSIDLPMCKSIGEQAFENCTSLTEINLSKIEHIGALCFYNCQNLKTITIGNEDIVCQASSDTFSLCPLETINVPNNLVEQYKSHEVWSIYANIIVGFDPDIQ